MSQLYYIDNNGVKDGPHDLIAIMRRIKAERVERTTAIFVGDAAESLPAHHIPEIALFFGGGKSAAGDVSNVSLTSILRDAKRFTFDNNIVTVYAGGMLLLSIFIAIALINAFGFAIGAMASWASFMVFQYLFFIFTLRMYRMQPFSAYFMNEQLAPVLLKLFIAAVFIGVMMIGGLFFLVFPAIIVAVYYAFVPFLIYDRRMGLLEAMAGSRLLMQKHNRRYQKKIEMLVLLYICCLILIFPIPIALPIFAASLAKIYEELSLA